MPERLAARPQPADGLDAVDPRHHEVGQQDVGVRGLDHADRLGAVARLADDGEAPRLEERPQPLADDGVVVADHDADRRRVGGRRRVASPVTSGPAARPSVPSPGADVIVRRPPSDAARSCIDVSPSRRDRMARASGSKPRPSSATSQHRLGPAVASSAVARRTRTHARRRRAAGRWSRPPGRSAAPRARPSGSRSGGSSTSSSTSTPWTRPASVSWAPQHGRQPVALEVGGPQPVDHGAQLGRRSGPTGSARWRAARPRRRGRRAAGAAAVSAASCRLNSDWLMASCSSRARRPRSWVRASSRLSSNSRAWSMAMAACEASSTTAASSAAVNAGAALLVGEVEGADDVARRHDRHAEERPHRRVRGRPPAAEAGVLGDVVGPVGRGVGQHGVEQAVGARQRAEAGDQLVAHAHGHEPGELVALGLGDADGGVAGVDEVARARRPARSAPGRARRRG